MNDHERVSESYLIFQRGITALDEWGFYALLVFLLVTGRFLLMIPVGIVGAILIWISYKRQWAMEEQRFGSLWETDMYLHHEDDSGIEEHETKAD